MHKSNQTTQVETSVVLSAEEMEIVQANLRFAIENCPTEGGILLEDGTTSTEQSVKDLLKKLETSKAGQINLPDLTNKDIRLLKAIAGYAIQECPIDGLMLDSGRVITKDALRALKEKYSLRLPQKNVSNVSELSGIETLEEEHKLISRVVRLLPEVRRDVETGTVDEHVLSDIIQFFSEFTNGFHHAKEEDQLFPILVQQGVSPKGCPLGALTFEHQQGHSLMIGLNAAVRRYQEGDSEAIKTISEILKNMAELYTDHIWKEDYLLLPMSEKVLSGTDREALAKDFAGVQEKFGSDFLEQYESIVERLEKCVTRLPAHVAVARAQFKSPERRL
jgi:hemerythrin-like domain-containing protein